MFVLHVPSSINVRNRLFCSVLLALCYPYCYIGIIIVFGLIFESLLLAEPISIHQIIDVAVIITESCQQRGFELQWFFIFLILEKTCKIQLCRGLVFLAQTEVGRHILFYLGDLRLSVSIVL